MQQATIAGFIPRTIKSESEVDVAYLKDDTFWPVEIKWTNQLRPKDLKQISKYTNGLILTKSETASSIFETPTYPLLPGSL